jgi:hypothetical protein
MLALRSILVAVAIGSLLFAAGVLLFDLFFVVRYRRLVAERLSDKLQIMMVPADGKFFFANDVLRSMSANHATEQDDAK